MSFSGYLCCLAGQRPAFRSDGLGRWVAFGAQCSGAYMLHWLFATGKELQKVVVLGVALVPLYTES